MSNENFFKRKRGFHNLIYSPTPFPKNFIVGSFNGDSIVIEDMQQKQLLYSNGGYGKGNLSRSVPNFKSCIYSDVDETSNLMLEEAFFLSYVVGCLQVKFQGIFLNLDEIWKLFKKSTSNFLPRYLSYQHFRMAGWVVRSGIKFGTDFILYKQGPEFHHATYSVLVGNLNTVIETTDSWVQLATANRITESVSKELLLCNAVLIQAEPDFSSPACIEQFLLNVVVLKRWVPALERVID
ncbi:tRNA-splicing endonuclease subunit Sen2-like isoform X1 [Daphnia pulicaria]|uniref:tRNA-splicing endonuclease subunit Sen2-like isoform X1 n=1 Tax=Daphnia pulicaria TaxID=35523 RepID=UPI001EEA7D75|nr:tRNA-splicing endonuclease subunit Sen2-like isoform X1 [Daphnia pulicaria]